MVMNRVSWLVARLFLFAIVAGFVPACGTILGFDDFTAPDLVVDSGGESASSADPDQGDGAVDALGDRGILVDAPSDHRIVDAATDPQDVGDATTDPQTIVDTGPPIGIDANGPAVLLALTVSIGTLIPQFSPTTLNYSVVVHDSFGVEPFTVTAYTPPGSALNINGAAAHSGIVSAPIPIPAGKPNIIDVSVANSTSPTLQHYSIVVNNVPLYDYVKASNTRANASFSNVSISGDTLVVGSPGESSGAVGLNGDQSDVSAPNAGAVYVFRRSGTLWAQEAYIKASNTRAGAFFGSSVSIVGDALAVGSCQESSGATGIDGNQTSTVAKGAGAAYVFKRTGTAWAQEAYVKPSNTRADALFGVSIALSGDTLAVGASTETSGATGVNGDQSYTGTAAAGAAYVFTRFGSSWVQQAYVKASNTRPSTYFGESLALSGDTLSVGARGEPSSALGINGNENDTSAASSGAVYVFTRTGLSWAQQAYVKASSPSIAFGTAVALDGNTLAAGSSMGTAYVFQRAGNTWAQQATITASNARPGNTHFGHSLALVGNVLAVGDTGEASSATGVNGDQTDTSRSNQGAVYVYARAGATWTQQAYVKALSPMGPMVTNPSGDEFGASIGISGDTLAIGAPNDSSAGEGVNGPQTGISALLAGAVYLLQ